MTLCWEDRKDCSKERTCHLKLEQGRDSQRVCAKALCRSEAVLQQRVEKTTSGGDEVQGTEAQCEKIHQLEQTGIWDCVPGVGS